MFESIIPMLAFTLLSIGVLFTKVRKPIMVAFLMSASLVVVNIILFLCIFIIRGQSDNIIRLIYKIGWPVSEIIIMQSNLGDAMIFYIALSTIAAVIQYSVSGFLLFLLLKIWDDHSKGK